jgi:NAD(P)-dependent dehydrogenase (short-subunit alcohol dehydrogenase family)
MGKTIFITGGASGIGLSITKTFAEAGVARIAIVSRSSESYEKVRMELEPTYPSTKFLFYQVSVTDSDKINNIMHELGTIDVLVLNAAVAHRRAEASAITEEEMREAFETNVIAPFNLVKTYLTLPMPVDGGRTIINISSAAAHMLGFVRVGYGSSKAAAVQVMQSFAAQCAKQEIRIFSFHPGSYYTPGVAANMAKDTMQWEDINLPAHFARWLAGPESTFLHGRFVWANWDVDELVELRGKLMQDPSLLTIGLIQ